VSIDLKNCPGWAFLSLAANGLLALTIAWVLVGKYYFDTPPIDNQSRSIVRFLPPPPELPPELGPRHQLSYRQWVRLLRQEATVVARSKPKNLTILLGDSLSLWFPPELLPPDRYWLNQGISGETSAGLLNRLNLLDRTEPEVILLMIGINDLVRGVDDVTLLANQQAIIRYLRRVHPDTKIVVQSILPHGGEEMSEERRDRFLKIPNSRIRELNDKLAAIAKAEEVIYLDLYPLFSNEEGELKTELSSDGLHLSPEGYQVWHYALQVLSQLQLNTPTDTDK
jgi:lysophospholipase L1-like esterase